MDKSQLARNKGRNKIMLMVYKSRFTQGLKNGEDIDFQKGKKVRYRMRDGYEVDIVIDSELMQHSGYLGYESIFLDNNQRAFAVKKGIVDWDGKVD